MSDKPLPAYDGDEPYIFVTYSHADTDLVYPQIRWLQDRGFKVWWDEGIGPGAAWHNELAQAIRGASLLLYFVTPNSVESEQCVREINFGLDEYHRPVLAVHFVETVLPDALALSLSDRQAILQHTLEPEDYERKLISAVATYLEQPVPAIETPPPAARATSLVRRNFIVGTAVAAVIAIGVAWWLTRSSGPVGPQVNPSGGSYLSTGLADAPTRVMRTSINLGIMDQLPGSGLHTQIALSSDGYRLIYRALVEGRNQLYLRELGELESRVVGTLREYYFGGNPFFSADGEWVGFSDGFELMTMPVRGGRPQALANTSDGDAGGFWTNEQTILFTSRDNSLHRVSVTGGSSESLKVPLTPGTRHLWPQTLPGGEAILFTAVAESGRSTDLFDLRTGKARTLVQGGVKARYARSGHIVFVRLGSLWAVPFDLSSLEITGEEIRVVQGVETTSAGNAVYAFSEYGRLVYLPGTLIEAEGGERTLVWVDREGREEPLVVKRQNYWFPQIAPDGEHVAVTLREADGTQDIWVHDLGRGTLSRRTFTRTSHHAIWTPDGERLVFGSSQALGLWWAKADGSGQPERLTSRGEIPEAFSLDGSRLVFRTRKGGNPHDMYMLSMDGEHAVQPLVVTKFQEGFSTISPNGRWIAYEQTKSTSGGKAADIYVSPFPNVDDGRWQISTNGGEDPIWARDGKELFYRSRAGNAVVAVPVETESDFKYGKPEVLFTGNYTINDTPSFDVALDGQRFLMIRKAVEKSALVGPQQISLVVVENWFDDLKRLAPPASSN